MKQDLDPRKLRLRRIEAGMTQVDLARGSGVTKSHVCAAENGRAGFSPRNLNKIAETLNCKVTDLMPDEQTSGNDMAGVG